MIFFENVKVLKRLELEKSVHRYPWKQGEDSERDQASRRTLQSVNVYVNVGDSSLFQHMNVAWSRPGHIRGWMNPRQTFCSWSCNAARRANNLISTPVQFQM